MTIYNSLNRNCIHHRPKKSMYFYRPQRSCEGYVFTPVCLSTGGGFASAYAGIPPRSRHPPGTRHPQSRHPPGTKHPQEQAPPGADTPTGAGTPPEQTPPGAGTPLEQAPPGPDPSSQQTATVADGTHPTGMHSCYLD